MKHEGKQHFSHEHLLIPIQRDDEDEEIQCKTCKELIEEESFHGCPACEFCLHEICLKLLGPWCTHLILLIHWPSFQPRPIQTDSTAATHVDSKAKVSVSAAPTSRLWFYYCEACEFVVHITCLFLKLGNKETSAESSDEVSVKEGEGSSGDGKQEPVGSSDEEDDNEEDSDEDVVRVLRYVLSAYANTLVLEDTPDD
ncbi:hypothetical protein DH2020_025698 [Rehmannia glutinosa]|uniref:Phorbol-ester/DAG-type domain-containing protein n=1 Tax=Rehmannia glutinosa TaxID=99300 RepID=A0ABR0W3C7_REHGL